MRCEGIDALTGKAVELQITQGRITGIKPIDTSDPLPYLTAGFFDIQVNGYRGDGYSHENLSEESINKIIAALAASGTTHHLPTLVTLPDERLLDNLHAIARAVKSSEDISSAIAGIHIEGPYISAEDGPRGAHDRSYIRDPDVTEFYRWQEAAEGLIRLITLAPERKGAIDFIQKVSATGVVVAIGHSAAEAALIDKAIEAGAGMTTHLGNGSHNLLPRLKNYIWEQLADDRLAASIICDGFHLPPSVVKVFRRAKGLKRLILASDAAYYGGLAPGLYRFENTEVKVFEDGHLGLAGTEFLAGAAHLLDWDIAGFMKFTGCSLAETLPLCTTNPAKLLGVPQSGSKIAINAPANLVLFNHRQGSERLEILKTWRNGRLVFEAQNS
jgi:N-acetylglucosamine-6-phosphate deacetylase